MVRKIVEEDGWKGRSETFWLWWRMGVGAIEWAKAGGCWRSSTRAMVV